MDTITIPASSFIDVIVPFKTAFSRLPVVAVDCGGSGPNVIATIKVIHNFDIHIRMTNFTSIEQNNRGFSWVAIGK